jgi:polyhydroxybutyrate depolymerase
VDTAQRRALLHLPPAASAGRRLPLVIAFHGAEGTGQELRNGTGFNDVADMRGVLVAYPDAPLGNWAEDCGCNNADRLGANDTGFVRALVDSVARITPLDRQRIYAVGFSQGALFTMRLGCQLAEQFAAVAGVAGAMSAPLSERCRPVRPIATSWVVGKNDTVFPYGGSGSRRSCLLGAEATFRLWLTLDRCQSAAMETRPDEAGVIERRSGRECAAGVEVTLHAVHAGGHAWRPSPALDTNGLLLEFLLRQATGFGSELGRRPSDRCHLPPGHGDEFGRRDGEHGMRGPGRRPELRAPQQVLIEQRRERLRVAERRDPADDEPRSRTDERGVGLGDRFTDQPAHRPLVHAIRATRQHEHRPACRGGAKHQ